MTIKVIARKIKEPSLPYLCIQREGIKESFENAINENKKCIYISGLSGFGKTFAVIDFFQNQEVNKKKLNNRSWYILDEWDKDPVTFLSYIYKVFLENNLVSNKLEEFFSQALNNEKQIKNFIGLLSNELEFNLTNNYFLIIDNFQEVQNEPMIQQIIMFLLNYCPELLKIILVSKQNFPEPFYIYFMKNEIKEITLKDLMLTKNDAKNLLGLMKKDLDLTNDLLINSQKCISLFILLAQNLNNKEDLDNYYKNILLKTAINHITEQVYQNLGSDLKFFINQTLFINKISLSIIKELLKDNSENSINILIQNNIFISNKNDNDYFYNPSFLPTLKNFFHNLPKEDKDKFFNKNISILQEEDSENLLSIFLEAGQHNKIFEYLEKNYEYYFRNYLFETLEILMNELKNYYSENSFYLYLKIRILRSTGMINKAITICKEIKDGDKTDLIFLEEGISDASSGYFVQSLDKLIKLEKEGNLKLTDYIALINCIGICYMQIHNLDKALEYFIKAIELRGKIIYEYDLMKVYHNLGLAYTWLGDFNNAISSYEQALYLTKKFNIIANGMTYNNLAIIYNYQGEFVKAYNNCINGLELVNKTNNILEKMYIYLTLAETYCLEKNDLKTDESLETLEILSKNISTPILDALFFKLKAHISIYKKDFNYAEELINKAINIRKLSDGDLGFLEYKLELALINFYSNNYIEVLKNLDDIEQIAKQEKHFYHLARIYVYKTLSYFKLDKIKNFNEYQQLAQTIIKEKNYILLEKELNTSDNNLKNKKEENLDITVNKNLYEDDSLKIMSFGDLNVSKGDKDISKKDWKGKKVKLLFIYLLLNKTGVNREQIYQNLFPEGDKSSSAMYVMFNRLRTALSVLSDDTSIIHFSSELYSFNFSIDYTWDASNMEYLINLAKKK
ncbi:MAG: tetratricopeptide repeat protein [Cyanobacteriota bacterium]